MGYEGKLILLELYCPSHNLLIQVDTNYLKCSDLIFFFFRIEILACVETDVGPIPEYVFVSYAT